MAYTTTEWMLQNGYKQDANGYFLAKNPAPFEVGDKVVRLTKPSSSFSTLKKGAITRVTRTITNTANRQPVYDPNGHYQYVYGQKIQVEGSSQTYNSDGFSKVEENNMLMLEPNRATFVREFNETTVDGKVTREYVGEIIPFDNLSAAQVFASNEISDSIRKNNQYRKFAIFVEKAVAQAKKPEVEFA